MSDLSFNAIADHETITKVVSNHFNNAPFITTTQFREFLGISKSTDAKMRRLGQYPRIINLPGCGRNGRLLVAGVVSWLENGGCKDSSMLEENAVKKAE